MLLSSGFLWGFLFFLVFAFFLLELDENIVKGKFWFPRNYYLYGCFAYLHIVYKAIILWVLTRKKICLTIIWKKGQKTSSNGSMLSKFCSIHFESVLYT